MTTQETRHGPQSVRGPRINKGLVIVNTGNGKGKTTAAMGVLMRAWGRDMKVVMLQFIKHTTANFGEQRAAEKMGVTVRAMGDGFTWRSQDLEASADLARNLWEDAKEVIAAGEYDLVILDEFTYPMHYGWLPVEDVDRGAQGQAGNAARHHHRPPRAGGPGRIRRPGHRDERRQAPLRRRHQGPAGHRVLTRQGFLSHR